MALLHIFRVFLFFAMLSIATVGIELFTRPGLSHPHGEIDVAETSSKISSYDWISLSSGNTPEFSSPATSIALMFGAVLLWLALTALPGRPALSKLHEPQQFSRPPPHSSPFKQRF